MIRLIKKGLILLIAHLLGGCTFVGFGVFEVIEKSKEHRPSWAESLVSREIEDDNFFTFVLSRDKLADLPLGAKDAQAAALNDGFNLITEKLRKQIFADAAKFGIAIVSESEFQAQLLRAARVSFDAEAKIDDIYYEKILDRSGADDVQYFRVFVKVTYPKNAGADVYTKIAQALTRSSRSDLKKLGLQMQGKNVPNVIGH